MTATAPQPGDALVPVGCGSMSHSEALAGVLTADRALPSRRIAGSDGYGWRSMLARTYHDPSVADEFETAPSAALLVVVVTNGAYTIEAKSGPRWHSAAYQPGSTGVTAPLRTSSLRWRAKSAEPLHSVHMYLYPDLVDEISHELGGMGMLRPHELPDSLAVDDGFITATGYVIAKAIEHRASPLYADSLAHSLTAHLLCTVQGRRPEEPRVMLGRTALHSLLGYLREHLHEDVTLDDLAGQANMSKYHLLRTFKRSTGTTPHRYLVRLRMRKAASLLRNSSQTVQQVMLACGYQSAAQFSAAFRREYGCAPGQYRRVIG
ncbi:helix-turn-helix domain-containing protein [Kutzneria buriramensis]|uniref:AraC family transcriptional regulator n=1 Tax=Kutzneria buriramensis TaxID=1045776 RepID=A0A3E0GZU9_9PSEU|nr:AraC family transcriptional regulator [Kutzneria buriramensis]REH33085.1 AraC family transcriptional regulator [Kutzneria buriramensis]